MHELTLMGFDFGTKRIGVALGNTILLEAQALEIINSQLRVVRFAQRLVYHLIPCPRSC